MKGEKGSADYNAVDPWIHEWLTLLYTQYVQQHQKTLAQAITIIVNFDECGIQYKSLPQYSYLEKKQEIRAKKPVLCRITGLFGSSANGRKFKPVIIGKSAQPRAFKDKWHLLNVHYYHNKSAWMTKDIFRDWFINCFLHEVQPILDPDMQIQFLMDNCSSHNDVQLNDLDPQVQIRFLPPNTTSLIQPMDQAVLACVKAHQKKQFYMKLVNYCDQNEEPGAYKLFLKKYTIFDAINDIVAGWKKVPESTIKKAFSKVIPEDKWNELVGNDFDGFDEVDTVQNTITHIPSDIVPGDTNHGQTVVTNDAFNEDIQEIETYLNSMGRGLSFSREDIIEDVLLNPGPVDENIDNLIREVLKFQEADGCDEDMIEVDTNVQVHTGNIRATVRDTCKNIQALRFDKITTAMPSYKYDEWRELLKKLETLTMSCYDIDLPVSSTVPATSSTDAVASTSGLNIAAAAATTTTTATTTTSTGKHSDEVNTSIVNDDDFGTENVEFLNVELVQVNESDLSLPDLEVTNFKTDPTPSESDIEAEWTHFRALTDGEKRSSNKYSHINIDTSVETDSD